MRNGHVNIDFRRGIVCHWCSRSPPYKFQDKYKMPTVFLGRITDARPYMY